MAYYDTKNNKLPEDSTAFHVLEALESYDLKDTEKPGEYLSNSPLHEGSDSGAFSITIHDGEHGGYKGFTRDDEHGSLYDLGRKLHLENFAGDIVAGGIKSYSNADAYAIDHGLTPDELRANGWIEITYQDRPALVYSTENGERYRFIDGKKPKYKSQDGYKPCWYRLYKAIDVVKEKNLPLILTNGEISVVAAQKYGIPAVSTTGGEGLKFTEELITTLKNVYATGAVVIVPDCDAAGHKSAKLHKAQLEELGYAVSIAKLPFADNSKCDLADFCKLYPTNTLESLLQLDTESEESNDFRLPDIEMSNILDAPTEQWLLKDHVLRDGVTIIWGQSSAGKTHYTLKLMLDLAIKGYGVYYVCAEARASFPKRVTAWLTELKSGLDIPLAFNPNSVNLTNQQDIEKLIRRAKQKNFKIDAIVFDTLAASSPGINENDSGEMTNLLVNLRGLMAEFNAAGILVHHMPKYGEGPRGSGALTGDSDVSISITRNDVKLTAHLEKERFSPITPGNAYEFFEFKECETEKGNTSIIVPMPAPSAFEIWFTKLHANILQIINEGNNAGLDMSYSQLTKLSGVTEIDFFKAYTTLSKNNLVKLDDKKKVILTATGLERLPMI